MKYKLYFCSLPYTARSAGQKGFVNILQLSYGYGGWDALLTNQSEAGKSKLFCDWLTKLRPGWHCQVYGCKMQLCTQS